MKLIVLVCKKYSSSTIPQYLRPCTVVWGYHSELETGFWYIWSSLSSDINISLYGYIFRDFHNRVIEKCKMWQQRGKYGSELHHETQEPEQFRPGRCKQPRAGHGWFLAQQPRAWAVWAGRLHVPWAGADPVWLRHCERTPVLFVCSIPPSLPTAQLNKWA